MDLRALADIEDHLVPRLKLDVWQRALYYHILRHTRAGGKESEVFAIDPLAQAAGLSTDKTRRSLRELHEKGCIPIDDRSRSGHVVSVLLPSEFPGILPEEEQTKTIDIERVDFFNDRRHLPAILERENGRCFYCLRQIQADKCELDHVVPQVNGIDNSYRNIVATCHECNTTKQGRCGEDFVRAIYRAGLLSQTESQERLTSLESLRSGRLVPRLEPHAT